MQKRYKTLYSKINAAMVSTSDKVKELVEILELTPLQIDLVELALQKSNDDGVRSNIFSSSLFGAYFRYFLSSIYISLYATAL
jgi:hypothetical protein